ncbi:hypothetical protein BDV12DRAFT_194269 [Aspergillus spectabilis]
MQRTTSPYQAGEDVMPEGLYPSVDLGSPPETIDPQFTSFLHSDYSTSSFFSFEAPGTAHVPVRGGTTPTLTGIRHVAPPTPAATSALRETLPYPMPDYEEYINRSTPSPWWNLPTPLTLPPQDPLLVGSLNNDVASLQHTQIDIAYQTARLPRTPVLQCKWQGCDSSHQFKREGDLIRHIRTIHISPGFYLCLVNNCGKSFGRKDHLSEHQKRRHTVAKP